MLSVPDRDAASPLPIARVARPTPAPKPSSAVRRAPVMLFDPYSQQMIVCTKPGGAIAPTPGGEAASGGSKAVLLLQLLLLSSVGVLIWFMLDLLQTPA
jgi:hypothetical protein